MPTRKLPLDPSQIKGFLAEDEGWALYDHASAAAARGPCLEIGGYCGKSTLYLGAACQARGGVLYSVDHHRGSEEQQPGEDYFDPDLFDEEAGRVDSFREFRRTLARAGLEDCVIPVVAPSELAARYWNTPLALLFIDGGHSRAAVEADYRAWTPHLMAGGVLAMHDIFADPKDGGQAPYEIYRMALESGLFDTLPMVRSLGLLRRLGD